MKWGDKEILGVLDACASSFNFPAMDNGYVYPAASKLSVYRSEEDWAFVIEVFGYSPRSQDPDISIYTIASKLIDRNSKDNYVTVEAYNNYLLNNPHNELRSIYPIANNEWQNQDEPDYVNVGSVCTLRNLDVTVPNSASFLEVGIQLEEQIPQSFEFCRYLASRHHDLVLCTEKERRISVAPEMELLVQSGEWVHPDISGDEPPSASKTFKDAALAITSGSTEKFTLCENPNSHWSNWPDAGTL